MTILDPVEPSDRPRHIVANFLRKCFAVVSGAESVMMVDKYEGEIWTNAQGQLHRTGAPAYANSYRQEWWLDGKLHRLDGPAIEWAGGTKAWYFNNKRHRLDGPAVERSDGRKAWFVEDKELTEQEFNAHPQVLALREQKRAGEKAAEEAARQSELDRMRKVLGAAVRDFRTKIRRPG